MSVTGDWKKRLEGTDQIFGRIVKRKHDNCCNYYYYQETNKVHVKKTLRKKVSRKTAKIGMFAFD